VRFSLGTRVRNRNLFGAFYMKAIDRTHRRYVAPTMLRMAVADVVGAEMHAAAASLRCTGAVA
jgi:hypothetical protein